MQQFKTSFAEAFKASRVLESLANYSRADDTAVSDSTIQPVVTDDELTFYNNETFWKNILKEPAKYYGARLNLNEFIISTWVSRVPGLFWTKEAAVLRKFSEGHIESVSDKWIHFSPIGKSAMVMGGIGTLKFNPDSSGYRIISLTSDGNASLGIPAIISNQLWNKLSLNDQMVVSIKGGVWNSMKQEWEQKFPFLQGLPRAYLVLDDEAKIKVLNDKGFEYAYQPFSIMEYTAGNALFYDYVFCSVHGYGRGNQTQEAADFFGAYREDKQRNGTYLIAAEPDGNIFKAKFSSPAELLAYDNSGKTNLELIEARVRNTYFKGQLLSDIIQKLSSYYRDVKGVERIAGYNQILLRPDPPPIMINNLVNECLKKNCLEVLIDHVAIEFPEILNATK